MNNADRLASRGVVEESGSAGLAPRPSGGVSVMASGVWQVPPHQRPMGWESMGGREPEQGYAPSPVSVTLDAVIEKTEEKPKPQAFEDLCAEFHQEWFQAIEDDGEWFGADDELKAVARIMIAGIYTRELDRLVVLASAPIGLTRAAKQRFEGCPIWECPDAVNLGEDFLTEDPDKKPEAALGFWLRALAGAGKISMVGPSLFRSIQASATPSQRAFTEISHNLDAWNLEHGRRAAGERPLHASEQASGRVANENTLTKSPL